MSARKVLLGTAQFGMDYGVNNSKGKVSDKELKSILSYALDIGVNSLDTADAYGDACARLKSLKISEKGFSIHTKLVFGPEQRCLSITDKFNKSLQSLGVDRVQTYTYHRLSDYKSSDFAELVRLKEKGLLKSVGVSIYDNDEFLEAIDCGAFDTIQVPFNLFDNYTKRGELIKKAMSSKIEVHIRSAFLQGLFFKEIDSLSGNIVNLKNELLELRQIASEYNLSVGELALRYAFSFDEISKVVIGVDSKEQLEKNISIIQSGKLPSEIINRVHDLRIKNEDLLHPGNWRL